MDLRTTNPMRRLPRWSSLAAGPLLLAGALYLAVGATAVSPPVPSFNHIFVVIMENHGYNAIIGSSSAPYINGLAGQNGLASDYFAVSHPSLPNYLALTGGSTFGITSDCPPSTCPVNAANIADRIEASGRTWRAYMESMPAPCSTSTSGSYAVKHNPFVYYDDIRTNAVRCQNAVVPYTQLSTDLSTPGATPNFVWITPNICNDMHSCSIATGDTWLKNNLPAIFASAAWKTQQSLLMLTWDEDDGSQGNQVATLLIGPSVTHGYRSGVRYNHYSLLKTVEQAWGLPALTTNDGPASAMNDFFGAVSPTPTPSVTPSATPRPTPTPTPTPKPTPSPSPSPSPSGGGSDPPLFIDSFGSGSCSAWTVCTGLVAETTSVHTPPFAMEGNTTSGAAYAQKALGATYPSVYLRTYFLVKSQATNIGLLKDRTASGRALAHLYVSSAGYLGLRNDVTGANALSSSRVSQGVWHEVELHLVINGATSSSEVWLDGIKVPSLSASTINLGTSPVATVELGDNQTGRRYDIVFDDVAAAVAYLP